MSQQLERLFQLGLLVGLRVQRRRDLPCRGSGVITAGPKECSEESLKFWGSPVVFVQWHDDVTRPSYYEKLSDLELLEDQP